MRRHRPARYLILSVVTRADIKARDSKSSSTTRIDMLLSTGQESRNRDTS